MEKSVDVLDYGPEDLAEAFRAVRNETVTIAEEIDEKDYGFSPAPEWRTIAQLLLHIANATRLQQEFQSINQYDNVPGARLMLLAETLSAAEKTPPGKTQILTLLRENGEQFAQWLEQLSPDFLVQLVPVEPGRKKTRFEVLLRSKEHEIHHRAQLMLIERLLGLVPHTTRNKGARMPEARTQGATA